MKFKVQEAIDYFNKYIRGADDPVMSQASLARIVFGKDSGKGGEMKIGNLIRGETKCIRFDLAIAICEACGVTPNFLFGWKK